MSMTTISGSGRQLTSGDGWKAPKAFPVKHVSIALAVIIALGIGSWLMFFQPEPPPPAPVDNSPKPAALSAVDVAGIGTLLGQFTTTAHEIRGEISDGSLKTQIIESVSANGGRGFGTLNVANIDGSILLSDGNVCVKGSPTFWSALGIQTNWPGWVHLSPGFLGDRIFYPSGTITAALAPVEASRILGNDYTANKDSSAVFGSNGIDKIRLKGYTVSVLPANNDGVIGTAQPMLDAIGKPAELTNQGSVWVVVPPPA